VIQNSEKPKIDKTSPLKPPEFFSWHISYGTLENIDETFYI
jgi:hypothetical protein